MKLNRTPHDPAALLEFYTEGLATLGAVCERTWHDRLEVLAEGRAAALWKSGDSLHEVELHFAPSDAAVARDAAREVFPGCPLTFHLAEALRPSTLTLERFVLPAERTPLPPEAAVAEKRWRIQFPETGRWHLAGPFKAGRHFTLLTLARCEIQAIDQHWSIHRTAVSLPGGALDDDLAREIAFHNASDPSGSGTDWPVSDLARWNKLLEQGFEKELTDDLSRVRARQEHSLRRELERIDDYFETYGRELTARSGRAMNEGARAKTASRLAAAKAEHARRRADQISRHEIRVASHVEALLLVSEAAWHAEIRVDRAHRAETINAHFIPRSRRWEIGE